METYVNQTPFLRLTKACNSSIDAIEIINEGNVDIVFSDIQMPGLNGLQLANLIEHKIKDKIQWIFTTAHNQYAIDGYKVNAIGYLLKPIGYDDFLQIALKAKNNLERSQVVQESIQPDAYLNVKVDYKYIRINMDEIILIESLKDYVKIYLSDERSVMVLSSLKSMETKLPEDQFVRVHRSYIIHKKYIQYITKTSINMGIVEILIGEMYKDAFKSILDEWSN
jgi:two-component system, LytTR family, response regulator LytT